MKVLTSEILVQKSNIKVEFNHVDGWLYTSWYGFQPYDVIVESCEMILETVLETRCTKILNDNTHIEGIWSGAAKWVAQDWFPRMQAAGVQHFAWVYSPSAFSQHSTNKALDMMDDLSTIRTFYDIEAASDWLRSC